MYCTGNTLDDDRDVYGREELHAELWRGRDRRVLLVGLRRTGKTAAPGRPSEKKKKKKKKKGHVGMGL